mmetsp:Transcript_61428/g.120580  ORF Transcript_61428/g.120580 Transcript_61428/m.120580 type:complete len:250 (+) Transcript_61428:87-836(+)
MVLLPSVSMAFIVALCSRGAALSHRTTLCAKMSKNKRPATTFTTTVVKEHKMEDTVKKSRFLAHCAHATDFREVKSFIEKVSDPKARHNCWAWVGTDTQRSNDDGEPSGTAGLPILNSIQGEGLVDVVVVVTRYKARDAPMLGAGGLLRAYGSAASLVLRSASRVDIVPQTTLDVHVPLSDLGAVQSIVSRYEGRSAGTGSLRRRRVEIYDDDGGVTFHMSIEADFADTFSADLANATNGVAEVSLAAV